VIGTDRDGRVTRWSDGAELLFGWIEAEVLGRPLSTIPRWAADEFERLRESVLRGDAVDAVVRRLRKDGTLVEVNLNVTPVRSRDKPPRVEGMLAVITEASSPGAPAPLTEGERRIRAVVDASPLAIIEYELDGRVRLWNRAAEQLFGWTSDEVAGGPVPVVPEDHRRAYEELIGRLRAGETFTNYETVRLRRDGTPVHVSISGAPIRDEHGAVIGMTSVVTDITLRKELEARLFRSEQLELVGRLAGGVAHDFNNLLTVIIGYSQGLLDRPGGEEFHAELAEIRRAADRAATLTRQLLAFSRRQVLQPRVLNLHVLLREMESMLRRLIGEHIELVCDAQPDLGFVKADPAQLEQVITNLAVNARDAMRSGGVLTIEATNVESDETRVDLPSGSYVRLAVRDTGAGIEPHVLPHIFEPFFTTKDLEGTGLGLASVYGTVTQTGGFINVFSELSRGTTFEIHLPRMPQSEPGLDTQERTASRRPQGTETILLVENEEALRRLTGEVLRGCGYSVLAASRPSEAFALSARHPGAIDLLLTDVVMPELSGPELAQQLLASRPRVRVLYMSGYTNGLVSPQGVLTEQTTFLGKPFTPAELAQAVRGLLDGAPLSRP
jgi:PAS domain S-box-containing protein